ncbi:hypothetical protein QBC47DRAFT_376153 [Echria macrotheca]|uniref:Uncharacterized protein n=1 Tax=Echria macrotheca TaxID=438768 RepID=A0AAJ0BGC4_9PEZI|nr:hypothetical protein QBC47DRAFT_376153 [Echria macrotheca]
MGPISSKPSLPRLPSPKTRTRHDSSRTHSSAIMSVFSDSTLTDWPSMASTLRASSSQSSHISTDRDLPKTDRLQATLANSWASYLSTQQSSRELGNLRRSVDEQIRHMNVSISSLQSDFGRHRDTAEAAANEYKEVFGRLGRELDGLRPFLDIVPALQLKVNSTCEQTTGLISNLTTRLDTVDTRQGDDHDQTSADIGSLRSQCEAVLGTTQLLQVTLDGIVSRIDDLGRRLAILEERCPENQPQDPAEILKHLKSMLAMATRVLGTHEANPGRPAEAEVAREGVVITRKKAIPKSPPITSRMRNGPERAAKQSSAKKQNLSALLRQFTKKYKDTTVPDITFIWEFIDSIENAALSKHIQESLAAIMPEHVSSRRDLRNKSGRHYIHISEGLSWKEFQKALIKVRPMGG